jgi:4a-hydroxytetrahydrobiopterin dehydratase
MSKQDSLIKKHCVPCEGGASPLKGKQIDEYKKHIDKAWKVVQEHHLEKEYTFPDFRHALTFTNLIGELAEREGHHPDIFLTWGKVKITLWTHKIDGLTESDFIMAAKCDLELPKLNSKVCY